MLRRNLTAELLENKQLLHGGPIGMAVDVTIDERVEAIFERFDTTEDGTLDAADELPERLEDRFAAADADESGDVTAAELTEHYETQAVSRLLGLGENIRVRGPRALCGDAAERAEKAIELADEDGEGDLDQGEVSEEIWSEISEADLDGDLSLSSAELTSYLEAADAERLNEFIANRVEAIFSRYDDGDGMLTASEVSERRWDRLTEADENEDEAVSEDELAAHLAARAEAASEANASDDGAEERGRRGMQRFRGFRRGR